MTEPLRSRKYLNGAKGSPCTFLAPWVQHHDPETTVFAHLNGTAFGKAGAMKAHDIAGLDACFECHAYIDVGHGTNPRMSEADFWWHLLRGVVNTMLNRAARKIVIVPLDPEALSHDKPTPPRKPKNERRPVSQSGPMPGTRASGVRKKMNGTVERRANTESPHV